MKLIGKQETNNMGNVNVIQCSRGFQVTNDNWLFTNMIIGLSPFNKDNVTLFCFMVTILNHALQLTF